VTDYLTLVEVLAIHADQIDRYGGAHGCNPGGRLICGRQSTHARLRLGSRIRSIG